MFDVNWANYLGTAVLEIPTGFALGTTHFSLPGCDDCGCAGII